MLVTVAVPVVAGPATAPSPQAGQWRFTRSFVDMALPGVPASAMQRYLNVPKVWQQCVAPAATGKLYDDLLGDGCQATRTMGPGGRLRVAGSCGDGRLEFNGIAAPRRITGIMTKHGRDGSFLKAQLALDRVGDC